MNFSFHVNVHGLNNPFRNEFFACQLKIIVHTHYLSQLIVCCLKHAFSCLCIYISLKWFNACTSKSNSCKCVHIKLKFQFNVHTLNQCAFYVYCTCRRTYYHLIDYTCACRSMYRSMYMHPIPIWVQCINLELFRNQMFLMILDGMQKMQTMQGKCIKFPFQFNVYTLKQIWCTFICRF